MKLFDQFKKNGNISFYYFIYSYSMRTSLNGKFSFY